jgi:hypothetical protein
MPTLIPMGIEAMGEKKRYRYQVLPQSEAALDGGGK